MRRVVQALEGVAKSEFDASAGICSVRDTEEWRAECVADRGHIRMVEDVGRAQVDGESLRIIGGVRVEDEASAEVHVEMNRPGHRTCIARKDAVTADGGELTILCRYGAGAAGGGVVGAIVEVAVTIVIDTGKYVEGCAGCTVEIARESDLSRQLQSAE